MGLLTSWWSGSRWWHWNFLYILQGYTLSGLTPFYETLPSPISAVGFSTSVYRPLETFKI